jgi:hypothetical protein
MPVDFKKNEDGVFTDVVEASWLNLKQHLETTCSENPQIIEMIRRTFYAGAKALFDLLTGSTIIDPETEPTDRDEAQMNEVDRELNAFFVNMTLNTMSGQ